MAGGRVLTAATVALWLSAALALSGCDQGTTPAAPATHPGSRAGLSYDQILNRCLPQLRRHYHGDFRAAPDASNTIVRNLEVRHRAGDFASFSEAPGITTSNTWEVNPTLCLIPKVGHAHDPVPHRLFVPRPGDPAQLKALCTEADGVGPRGEIVNLDLRLRGYVKILAEASLGHRVELVLENDQAGPNLLTCSLDAYSPNTIAAPVSSLKVDELGAAGPKSGYDVYHGAGFTSAPAATIEVTTPDGVVHRIPVRKVNVLGRFHGAYAFFLKTTSSDTARFLPVRVLAADGSVLSTQRWPSAASQNGVGR